MFFVTVGLRTDLHNVLVAPALVIIVTVAAVDAATGGHELHRADLSDEAIRLARMVHRMLPDDGEVAGLLALMLLTDARRPARTTAAGELVPLAEQERSRWDRSRIVEGLALLDRALAGGSVGEYQLQAAVAAVHDRAARAEDTDWALILALYGLLKQMTGNPVVTLNRAVAAAMAHGPAAGLAILDQVDDQLKGQHRVHAVRAHLLEMAGDPEAARTHYLEAARRTTSVPEQHYLASRAARINHRDTHEGRPDGYEPDMTTTPNEPSPDPDIVPSGDPGGIPTPEPMPGGGPGGAAGRAGAPASLAGGGRSPGGWSAAAE